ncbi:dedicator of cytokinesis protein 1 isoform X3 [Cimex lectularius]|uniref:Dedicator of cytokinesis protein 1 n=1 Tax=Cimex lectularius TaxID=79782 RepID=A0A8I6RZZ0_CIMLE|nr:dedicator of cytokinesis protein 1 isoform X3 [Cimex lectularius]
MTNSWSLTNDSERFAIVVQNFNQDGLHRLKVTLGESVVLLQKSSDWYYGFSTKNKLNKGIFPKSYVKVKEATIDRSGPTEEIVLNQPQIVQEVTSVLREWGSLIRNLYVRNSKHFRPIRSKMYELMAYRSQIISGKFPVDELKQIKRILTYKIDIGNKILGLDMVVRDEHGNILNPDVTSTVQLYRHHQLANERILKSMTESAPSHEEKRPQIQQFCHALFVNPTKLECKVNEELELLLCLYDAKENRPFTENHVFRWGKLENNRVLYTDLGTRDINREKVYLVCYIVRVGGMENNIKSNNKPSNNTTLLSSDFMRRPFGVAAKDITLIINGKLGQAEEDPVTLPLLMCEKDSLEGTLKRILTTKDLTHKDHKGQGLNVMLKMHHGDLKQIREENPHLVLGQVSVARKMGFPEVILPGDVRNDLYLTLVGGEFSKGSKTTDKNVQISVSVHNDKGETLKGVIQNGGEESEYRSVVYYHEDKPRWAETCKIAIPIEDFKISHLRFTFKHRSSNETKDKNEKPFALSYVKLMQKNGTTLADTVHELLVYKVDHKKYDPKDIAYLALPSTRSELEDGTKPATNGLTLTNKDSFTIQTNVCSTKLTQNIDLLSLLNWANEPGNVKDSLQALSNVSGEEIVKFLQDVLDALFNIIQDSKTESCDNMVFECLLYIIGLVSDRKYQHFQPVLDLYIQESFCATLAYNKLLKVLKYHVDNSDFINPHNKDILLKTMKSLQYIMKFIVRSRILFSELNGGKDEDEFMFALRDVLQSFVALMSDNSDATLVLQGTCLKYFPTTIPDIIEVFSPTHLSDILRDLIGNLSPQRLMKQKMMTLSDIIHSPLFALPECRHILLPDVLLHVKDLLEAKDEEFRNKTKSVAKVAKVLGESEAKLQDLQESSDISQVELCVNILSDIMDLLFRDNIGMTSDDLSVTAYTILRTVTQTAIAMDREGALVGNLVAIMLSILRQMGSIHFTEYIRRFPTNIDLLDFLMEILLVFKDLVSRPVYPKDWSEMIMLQNSIILKSLHFFSHTIRDHFFSKNFEHQAWNNFFHCAISFLTQPALQLEMFSPTKKRMIVKRYKDMRMDTGSEIRRMWFNLGQHKKQFIPGLVGPFLEMTLIPESELRSATLPIFFDMMQCEFYSQKDCNDNQKDSTKIKANFHEFENEMISKLDNLVEGGRGDVEYKELFYKLVGGLCENHSTLKDQGLRFVKTVSRLMERLLEYRCIINDENKENRMSCTVNLLDFYSEINRKEMYIRYLNKLCDLHLECDNFTEAAYTLKLHSNLLSWSDDSLHMLLRSSRYPNCTTHRQLKEALYTKIIEYFDQGKMWECAVEICKELADQYENHFYDLKRLSSLLKDMASFYDKIMGKLRPEPEYFRVAYYGKGFPHFLQNKVFIYRGKEYERLSDFSTRTLNQLPKAELLSTLTMPGDDITQSNHQYLQINSVEPMMDEKRQRKMGQYVSSQVLKYHRVNNVQKFRFSRPIFKRDSIADKENEFATLWVERHIMVTSYPLPGILRWFPVTATQVYTLSPLANAIETMQASNNSLRELILDYKNDPNLNLNPLSMKLNGIVDPAVMGGITNYEKAFFTSEFLEKHPESLAQVNQLKELIACQIPLLDVGIKTHRDVAPPQLLPLQQKLEECFTSMQAHVFSNYGVKNCDIKYEPVQMRRQASLPNNSTENRLSGTSFGSTEGSRSRVSSLTRSQVASLKTFVNFATMSPSSTLSRASSVYVRSTSMAMTTPRKDKKKKRRHTNKEKDVYSIGSSSTLDSSNTPRASSQWYTGSLVLGNTSVSTPSTPTTSIISCDDVSISPNSIPVIELRQQSPNLNEHRHEISQGTREKIRRYLEQVKMLTPTRPLRSEVEKEKRLSRPPSGQFSSKLSISNTNGNRDSIGGSSIVSGLTDSTASEEEPPPLPAKSRDADYCNLPDEVSSGVVLSTPSTPRVRNKPIPPVPIDVNHPPTPPPKRSSGMKPPD